ncbi:MAG TPA: L-threonylcarbamoyladenylate synthase [Pirellulales bacterium]|jgi:L-threonylcarbamoyladenylate synthase|nr:L-threonylcarbamoyladenylate synthase [Pirellulales bacterium]
MTETYHVRSSQQESIAIERAAEVLRRGGLVAFPTETVYGLGANALDPKAVARIFAAKGRPANNPLIVHVASVDQARDLAAKWPETARRLAARFWPGPLTLVVAKRPIVPGMVTAGAATVGLRIPAHPVARALIDAARVPIAAPSANRSNEVSPTTAEHVLKGLGAEVDIVLDGGRTSGGLESTVLDLTFDPPRLLRPGLVTPAEIERVIGPIQRAAAVPADQLQPLASPGQLPRHYAPRAAMECCAGDGRARVAALARAGVRVGWLALAAGNSVTVSSGWKAPGEGEELPPGVKIIPMPVAPADYATQLYAALHALDDSGVERIIVDLPPDSEPWLAIRDRLRRGSVG